MVSNTNCGLSHHSLHQNSFLIVINRDLCAVKRPILLFWTAFIFLTQFICFPPPIFCVLLPFSINFSGFFEYVNIWHTFASRPPSLLSYYETDCCMHTPKLLSSLLDSFFRTKNLFRYTWHNSAPHNLGCWIDFTLTKSLKIISNEYTVFQ